MARKKSKKSSKKSPAFWQWIIVAGAAFLLYQGLQHWLDPDKSTAPKRSVTLKSKPEKAAKEEKSEKPEQPAAPVAKAAATPTPAPLAPTPAPVPTSGPVPKWNFQSAGRFLPKDAYPDNYNVVHHIPAL